MAIRQEIMRGWMARPSRVPDVNSFKLSFQTGKEKRKLTPEQRERQTQLAIGIWKVRLGQIK